MPKQAQKQPNNMLAPRRLPRQQRAKKRTQQILDITAQLLDKVGVDELTTVLIAKELGISVGSLYHYFANKHSILYALGARWLEQMTLVLEQIEHLNLHTITLNDFVDEAVERMYHVYKSQHAVLPLAQALWSIPELRDLDKQHDQFIINKMVGIFKRLGFHSSNSELNRLGRAYLELTHALLLVVVEQKGVRAKRTHEDLKRLVYVLLEPHQKQ